MIGQDQFGHWCDPLTVWDLDISTRTLNCLGAFLDRNTPVEILSLIGEAEFRSMKGVGRVSCQDLQRAMDDIGLTFSVTGKSGLWRDFGKQKPQTFSDGLYWLRRAMEQAA